MGLFGFFAFDHSVLLSVTTSVMGYFSDGNCLTKIKKKKKKNGGQGTGEGGKVADIYIVLTLNKPSYMCIMSHCYTIH